jgi:anhydro-N-acetylmuramic acid kinase
MIVAGVMSGTSADGIDVALVRLAGRQFHTRMELLRHQQFPFPAAVRRKILSIMNGAAPVSDLARLSFLLGELYARAVQGTEKRAGTHCELIGCHGQTIYHQGEATPYLGRRLAVTWQTGEGAIIAARCGVPVVSDFRPADMAAGGKGAPLVPFVDYLLYRDRRQGRIVQNLGGIGNLTAIPAGGRPEQVVAFDTGPGNMVIDALMERLYRRPYDQDGRVASSGKAMDAVVSACLRLAFFRRPPPRTAGREEFGREFAARFLQRCGRARKADVVATATLLTARSISQAIRLFLRPVPAASEKNARPTIFPYHEFIVSGGGARNRTLMDMIAAELAPLQLAVRVGSDLGLPAEAKEAAAFAVLAYQTWHRIPANLPSATGASRPAILGKVSYP